MDDKKLPADLDHGRRTLALSLLGVLGGAMLSKGCAPGDAPLDDSRPYDPEQPDLESAAQALVGTTSIVWFDRPTAAGADPYLELKTKAGDGTTTGVNVAVGRNRSTGGIFKWHHGSTTPDDGGTVIAPTANSGRWKRIFWGPVNVMWFGAAGNGSSNDGPAIQAALDTGRDVYIPVEAELHATEPDLAPARELIYLVTEPLIVRTPHQTILGGVASPHSSADPAKRGHVRFDLPSTITNTACISVTATAVGFEGLTFSGIDRSVERNHCIHFAASSNTDDMDGRVTNCVFNEFDRAVKHVGRGLLFNSNRVANCNYGVELSWPIQNVGNTALEQDLPWGHRAARIQNNRFHVMQHYAIYSTNALLRGALIEGNCVDIGEGLLQVDGDIENSVISNNVVEFSGKTILRFYGDVRGLVVNGNVFSGMQNHYVAGVFQDNSASRPFAILHVRPRDGVVGTVEGLSFSNNRCSNTNGDAILFETLAYGVSIVGNTFSAIGLDGEAFRAIVRASELSGLSFVANSCYGAGARYVMRAVANHSWRNVLAQMNNFSPSLSGGGGFSGGYVDGGQNNIQT